MKRKAAKLISLILTAALIFSCQIFTAFAEELEDPKNPSLISSSEDTITLKAEDNFEYAIQVTKDDGTLDWQWAEPEQYDTEEQNVTFTELTPDTEYTFAQRVKDTDTIEEAHIQTYKTAAAQPPETEPETQSETTPPETEPETQPETTPPETEPETQPETTPPETEPETQPETTPPETEPETQPETTPPETEPETQPETTSPETEPETQPETTPPETEPETEPETTPPETEPETQPETTPPETQPETIKAQTPDAPKAVQITDTQITAAPADGADDTMSYEYRLNGGKYQDSPEFKGLMPGTEYKIYIRVKAGTYDGKDYEASDDSTPLTVTTKLSAAAAPEIPEISKRTDTEVTFKTDVKDMEFGIYNGSDITWQKSNTFSNLTAGSTYTFVFRISFNDTLQMPSEMTDSIQVTTLLSAAPAPDAPVLESRTETSLKVKTVKGLEYALMTGDSIGTWQTGAEFTQLKPNTSYQIVARKIYDPETALESLVSKPLTAKTVITFDGSLVSGIEAGKTYEAGTSFKITASGNGMDNKEPAEGDTRYKPTGWHWGGSEAGVWANGANTTAFTLVDAGSYTLYVTFGLETYSDGKWQSTDTERTIETSFNIKAKEFTIKATATKGGKISPSGTLTVLQAKNYTFKMTPDKEYALHKLYIDGKEVKFNKDLSYTFEKIDGNHTIHAVFEKQAVLDAPKTGDNPIIVTLITSIAGISLIAVIVIAFLLIKKRIKK